MEDPREPEAPKPVAHTAGGRDIRGWWEWIERGVLLGTLASVVLGGISFWIDQNVRRQAAIAQAWQLVTTPAVGNSGKRPALEFLVAEGISLAGMDLSCQVMGGVLDLEGLAAPSCTKYIYLRDVNLTGADLAYADLSGVDLRGANFRGANLNGAVFAGAYLVEADFSDSYALLSDFSNADLSNAIMQQAFLEGADLRGTLMWGTDLTRVQAACATFANADISSAILVEADLSHVEVSGAAFYDTTHNEPISRTAEPGTPNELRAWAWHDRLPSFSPAGDERIPFSVVHFDAATHRRDTERGSREVVCTPGAG